MLKPIRIYLILILFVLAGCSSKKTTTTSSTEEGSGMQFTEKETLDKINKGKAPFYGSSNLPASVDLSPKMPPPGNQGAQNSCVGWSIAYGMKSYQEKTARNWDVASGESIIKEHVFSPAYIYNQINHGQDKGSKFADAFNLLQTKGVASLSTNPYDQSDFTSPPTEDANKEASNFKIAWAKTIDPKDIEGIKSYLAKGYPVIIAVAFDKDFTKRDGDPVVKTMDVNAGMGHAMLIVGYDDNKQCLRIMNSWGTDWRDGGFCWFTYDVFQKCIRECWIAKDMEDKKDINKEDEPQINNENPIVDELLTGLTIKNIEENSENADGKSVKFNCSVKLDNDFGDEARIIVFLNYDNGDPVLTANEKYSYMGKEAAGYTEAINLTGYSEQVKDFSIYIPYSALKIDGDKKGNVNATPVLFIDDFDATVGKPVSFRIPE